MASRLLPKRHGAVFELFLEGSDALLRPLLKEAGAHKWQRIPPTERKGRVQTSTVTVAVFEVLPEQQYTLRDQDIRIITTTAGGPGGQHQNKTQSAVIMKHLPTGIEASSSERCQHQNKRTARAVLEARVASFYASARQSTQTNNRRAQIGAGEDVAKVRTYREKDNLVLNDKTGKKARLSDITKGNLEKLLN